ncbi:MAG: GatB/YqeY domain-containing protein [Bacteroidetes bacterium]|nr:GatB/YqeY domain-containing protein [Bacteroidota bacterium]
MALSDKINEDLKAAMKSGDPVRLNTIRSIRAQIIELSKRGTGTSITQEEEAGILLAAAKKRREAIEIYEKAGRLDLAGQEKRELEIISAYLPKQLSREEAEAVVKKIIENAGAASMKDFGKVMPAAMKELKGQIDGKIVQEVVKKQLGE